MVTVPMENPQTDVSGEGKVFKIIQMNEWNLLARFADTQILWRTGFNVHNEICQLTKVGFKA